MSPNNYVCRVVSPLLQEKVVAKLVSWCGYGAGRGVLAFAEAKLRGPSLALYQRWIPHRQHDNQSPTGKTMPPPPPLPPRDPPRAAPRVVCYHQTHYRNNDTDYVSILPLINFPTGITHLILAAIHLNDTPGHITLNNHPPSHPLFEPLWAEVAQFKAAGIPVLGMLGGAAKGTFERLDRSPALFEAFYVPLRDVLRTYGFDGLDLDVEEYMSLQGVIRLIDRLKADFGDKFIITLAPVATALQRGRHISGFDYEDLEVARGGKIAWYNTQFYCGWGSMGDTQDYDLIMACGWPASKVVAGVVTNGSNGRGWVPTDVLQMVIVTLMETHPGFGGVMGWEYFNSLPGDVERPWEWAQSIETAIGLGLAINGAGNG